MILPNNIKKKYPLSSKDKQQSSIDDLKSIQIEKKYIEKVFYSKRL